VTHYFQVLALFKSFQRRVHPTLLKQELQTFECIKQHILPTDKLIKFVKLSMWWLPQISGTHIRESRWFELMYTLQGKSDQHATHIPRSVCVWSQTIRISCATHSNLSRSRPQSWAVPLLLRKRAPDTIHSTPTDWSMSPYPVSLSSQPMKQWGQIQHCVDGHLVGLPSPYHRHAIGTFNTCSWGLTHRSLTDTGGGYNHEGAGFPHSTSQPTVLPFSPTGSARSLV
jgi:hypothetical protein